LPNGSVVVVNISRWDVSWTGGLVVNGTAIGNVIYNFHEAGLLEIQGIDIQGSILAPKAKVNFVEGVIHGQMICEYFEGQGQMNNSLFHGSIYGNPEITNCAEISGFDQVDVNLSNNVSCAPIVVNVDYDPNNGGDINSENQWEEHGSIGMNEMIWSMYQSSNGLLVGTVGGNIYSSANDEFILLNEGMDVIYIWSLHEFNGYLYAGTELGLYKTDASTLDENSTWTKVAIDGDVRSITSLNNVLYVAVWGDGVFSSTDGTTWNELDKEGLLMCSYAVHTLTVANGELFAGTFGMGVLKYDFVLNLWAELPVGFPFIWSLATDENGAIYAGSYGGGAYVSTNGGEDWYQINNGLPNKYIYSVSVYGTYVYIST
ncbi:MAG: choice-of-anchor A family protein, partial [Melioribacteraceae bacterium]|nr:choice-of-anchor A family protein [Melioribacteraceae bacterium]